MKKCSIGLFPRIITFLAFVVFFVPLTSIALYFVFIYPQTHYGERLIFQSGLIMCVDLVGFAIYRMFYLGLVWVEYDIETVIFHYFCKEEYRFRWEEIPGSQVRVERTVCGYMFYVQGNGRQRKIPLNWFSKNYKDFEKALKETGVLERAAIITDEQMKQNAAQTWEQYKKPKPEGDYILCPDCQGKGVHSVKKLPLLKVDVGLFCKTCGGSGYVPK